MGCRKWGCNKWGLKGCLATLPGNRPFSPFFCLFHPFPEGPSSPWEFQKTEEEGLFPQISSDLLKPPSLKPPFAALQAIQRMGRGHSMNRWALQIEIFCAHPFPNLRSNCHAHFSSDPAGQGRGVKTGPGSKSHKGVFGGVSEGVSAGRG